MAETKGHWAAEKGSYRPSEDAPNFTALVYDPLPGGRKNENGSTTYSMRFPALILTEYVQDPDDVAAKMVAELNAFDDLLEALKEAKRYVEYLAGDDRTFVGAGMPSDCLKMVIAALAKAEGLQP